jgi:hypothetical protein
MLLMFRRIQAIKNPTRRNCLVGKAVRLRRKIRKLHVPYRVVLVNKAPAERKFAGVEVCDISFDDHMFVSGAWRGRNYLTLFNRSEGDFMLVLVKLWLKPAVAWRSFDG